MILFGPLSSGQTSNPNDVLEEHLWGTVRNFVRFQVLIATPDETDPMFDTGYSILFLIGLILMGAGLISDDRRNLMDEIYESKISRRTYLFGKFGSILLFGNLLLVIPTIIEWGLLIVGISNVDIMEAIPVLIGVIVFAEIVVFVLSLVVLSFSSLFTNRIFSSILVFGFFLAITSIFASFVVNNQSFTPIMYLDLFTVLTILSFLFQGEQTVIYYDISDEILVQIPLDLTGDAGFLIFPFLFVFISINCLLCYMRVIWRDKYSITTLWKKIRQVNT